LGILLALTLILCDVYFMGVLSWYGCILMICKHCKWIHFLLHCMGTTFGNCEDIMFWSNILVFLWVTISIPILWTHDSHGNCLSALLGESWCKIKFHPSFAIPKDHFAMPKIIFFTLEKWCNVMLNGMAGQSITFVDLDHG
jgi:hypothetical protein